MAFRTCWKVGLILLPLSTWGHFDAAAQQPSDELAREIQDSQRRLEEIRGERARLQREMGGLRTRVQNVSGELANIERQLSASRSMLSEIDFQLQAATEQARRTTDDLLQTREELVDRQVILNRRLRAIYKRGPLHTARVLLGAESFGDLLNRYHYLRLIATYDRALVETVRELEFELVAQDQELETNLRELARLRDAQIGEVAELRGVEEERQRTLAEFQIREQDASTRLDQIQVDEADLTAVVATLERQRVEEENRQTVGSLVPTGQGSLSPTDVGRLPWPVYGDLAYSFGLQRRPDGALLRWNGIGIAAPPGTPVRAVRAGVIALAGPFEGYGPSVIVSHGAGYYTLYLHLEEIGVVQGRSIEAEQVLGTVGGSETPEGARVEFQIRVPIDGGVPQAVDPLPWLQSGPSDP